MADKFQNLIDAALTGDKREVDRVLKENPLSFFEMLALPGQFDALPPDTKSELAGVYQKHPDILPDAARPYADKALEGVTPSAPRGSANATPAASDVVASIPVPRLRPDQSEGVPATAGGTGNILKDFISSQSVPIDVRNAIADSTSMEGMTARAQSILQAAVSAGRDAGLVRIDIVAGKGGGHLSHMDGTEWDLVGRNADGSIWTNEQRVAVAQGARSAGADRFGLYDMDRGLGAGTIHIGYSHTSPTTGEQFVPAVWGAGGVTSGPASQRFTNPADRAFFAAYSSGKPYQGTLPATAAAYAPSAPAKVIPAVAAVNAVATGQPLPNPRPGAPPAPATPPKPALRPADLQEAARNVFDDNGRYRKGASGNDVREIQHFLNMAGATDDRGRPLKEDGVIGNLTRQAIKDYQDQHPELVKDGVIGPRTMAAMLQDQQAMQQAEASKNYGNMEGPNVPKLLTSLALADPITDQMWSDAAKAGAAAEAYRLSNPTSAFSGPAYVAANLGANLGGYVGSPKDYIASMPDNNPEGVWGKPPVVQIGGFSFHPGENFDYSAHARTAWNELSLPHDAPMDAFRTGGGPATLGPEANAQNGEIIYNATAAAARRLMEGPPSFMQENADGGQIEPAFFIPPPQDAMAAGGDPTSVNDPFPQRSPWVVDDTPPLDDPSAASDPFPQRSPWVIDQPTLSTDDANTLLNPDGSGSLVDNLTDPLGGAAG